MIIPRLSIYISFNEISENFDEIKKRVKQKIGSGENIENGVKLNFIIDCIFLKNIDPLFIIAFHLQNFNGY
ncbi:MAG: hypothetical protein K8R25_03030 [Methanosarcinales archaeon]|nr:hypothetical protein [Methanosarcinales archaeon]